MMYSTGFDKPVSNGFETILQCSELGVESDPCAGCCVKSAEQRACELLPISHVECRVYVRTYVFLSTRAFAK